MRNFAYGALTCLGRQTVSGILTASGQQFIDWSAAYRTFSQSRINIDKLFNISQNEVVQEIGSDQMLIAHMDDTILKKTGKKIPGTSWRRDPLGPPFQTNFIWGQRFLQISMALPSQKGASQSRAIPVDFHHCPTANKPNKKATEIEIKQYKEVQKQLNLSIQGVNRVKKLRQSLDQNQAKSKELYLSVDGSYTNSTVLKNLPERVTLIGRIRKDTRLHKIPELSNNIGRKKVYGDQIPTPEEIRKSDHVQWQNVKAWAAGKEHIFDVKVVKNLRWEKAGGKHNLQLVIIRPLHYRLTKKSRLLYRDPAYLICTDNNLNIEKLLQAYLWRWEIEVNFRDEKTLFGSGKAQVRNEQSAANLPAFIAAIYSYLLIAAHKTYRKPDKNILLPRPKWYPAKKDQRLSTSEIINLLRSQLWAKALGCDSFTGFVKNEIATRNRKNYSQSLSSALFYIRK
jgi:DDE superfamily endonuclease